VTAKHAKPDPDPGDVFAEAAQDRAELLAAIGAQADTADPRRPWRVVRQYNHLPESQQLCAHRWEWLADLCAYRRTARHAAEVGVFYTVRRAAS
jgi:hypothetical protein